MLYFENAKECFESAHETILGRENAESEFYHRFARMIPDKVDVDTLVLGPNNNEETVRIWLMNNGFEIAFEKIVEDAIKTDCKDTAIITHGGVIMTLLAAYGVPRAKFYEWVVNNGCGYSIRIMPSLWMRQKVGEVYAKIPSDLMRENNEESMYIMDLVREASNKAFGKDSD